MKASQYQRDGCRHDEDEGYSEEGEGHEEHIAMEEVRVDGVLTWHIRLQITQERSQSRGKRGERKREGIQEWAYQHKKPHSNVQINGGRHTQHHSTHRLDSHTLLFSLLVFLFC